MSRPDQPDGDGLTRRQVVAGGVAATATAAAARRTDAPPVVRFDGPDLIVLADGWETLVRLSSQGVASVNRTPPGRARLDLGLFIPPKPVSGGRKEATAELLRLVGDGITVEADRRDGSLRFLDGTGRVALAEAPAGPPPRGVQVSSSQGFTVDPANALFGLGQFRDPVADYRGRDLFLAHANMDAVSPYLVSTGRWGLLWDTGTAAWFRSNGATVGFHSLAGEVVRYHVMLGDGMDALVAGYRRLTGRAQLLGKWAYGYWQSKERYRSAAEVTAVVDRFRADGLPLDAVVLDWRYWGEDDQFSGMMFDPAHFPDPKAMVGHVHARNAHIIASVWPAFGPGTAIYRDMAAAGRLFPEVHWSGGRVFDATAADARAIYWRHIDAGLMSIGMDGLWTDGCEPEFMSTGNRHVTMRSFADNGREAAGPIVENLLTYSYYQARGLSEAMREKYPQRRPFILTRSIYPGQQAFGAVTWSGDIFAGWQTLRNQVLAAQHMALAGHPHWTCDIGGFLVSHRYPAGLADPAYRELYVRWFQWAAFLPVFRAHGTDVAREPWQFGQAGEPIYDALAAALRRRYAFIPYLYSLAARAALADEPILRPLVMDHPHDPEARRRPAQFGFGRDLMVRVVDRPLEHATAHAFEFIPNGAVQGLDATAAEVRFFEGAGFERMVDQARTDDLKLSWFGDLPRALRGKPWSARWTGRIVAEESGTHDFLVTAQGAVRLVLDGIVRVDAVGGPAGAASDANGGVSARVSAADREYRFSADLVAGRAYPFTLEQRQPTPDAVSLWVEWLTPSQRALNTPPTVAAVPVYLPAGGDWYDFATGERLAGGQVVSAAAPIARMPVYARAGAIVPMTPGIIHAAERADVIEIHVFAGADGAFTLYDDEGDGDGYLRGAHAEVPLRWDDAARRLHVGARQGGYPGMPQALTFELVRHDGGPVQRARHRYDGREAVLAA